MCAYNNISVIVIPSIKAFSAELLSSFWAYLAPDLCLCVLVIYHE